jgi:hypothetical protein
MTLLKAVMTECREQPAVTVEPTTAKAVTLCNFWNISN